MNTKWIVKAEDGRLLSCILNNDEDIVQQLGVVMNVNGGDLRVRIEKDELQISDGNNNEISTCFTILFQKDTYSNVSLKWTESPSGFICEKVYHGMLLERYVGDCETVVVPEGIDIIGYRSFESCKHVKKVILPEGVKSICAKAFENCTSLEEVIIPKSVKEFGENLFSGVGRDFSIIYDGTCLEFSSNVKVKIKEDSHTDGDYHHPTSTHFDYTVHIFTTYGNIFGDFGATPFNCTVKCLKDGEELKYSSCSPETTLEHTIKQYR